MGYSNATNAPENEKVKTTSNLTEFIANELLTATKELSAAKELFASPRIAEEQGKRWEEMLRSDDFIKNALTFVLRFDIDIGDVSCPNSDYSLFIAPNPDCRSLTITTSMLPPLFNHKQALENFKYFFAAETKVDKIQVTGMRCGETGYIFFVPDRDGEIFKALLSVARQDTNGFHITVRTPLYCLQTNEFVSEEEKLRLQLSSIDWREIL